MRLVLILRQVPNEPEEMAPPPTLMGRVRVTWQITQRVMLAMIGHPINRATFTCQTAQERANPANRRVGSKTGVRQQPMKTKADAQPTGHPMEAEREG